MEFKEHTTPEASDVQVTGRWEFTDHDRLGDIVKLLYAPGVRRVTLDLSGLEFIDSAGLGMLLILQDEAEQKNVRFVIRKPQGDVKRTIELAKIGEIITIEY